MQNKIDLLVTIDKNYIGPFRTMLKSVAINNPGEKIHVWLLHSSILQEDLQRLEEYCGCQTVQVEDAVWNYDATQTVETVRFQTVCGLV